MIRKATELVSVMHPVNNVKQNGGKHDFQTGNFERDGDKRGRGGDDFENNNSAVTVFQKKTFPMKSAWRGGKFKGKQGQSGGKYGAKSGGRTNFMDADGEFISRAFPTLEKISSYPYRTFRALHTNCGGQKLYCVDSGSNTFVTEEII